MCLCAYTCEWEERVATLGIFAFRCIFVVAKESSCLHRVTTEQQKVEKSICLCMRLECVWGVEASEGMRANFFSLFSASRKLHGKSLSLTQIIFACRLSHKLASVLVNLLVQRATAPPFDHYHNYIEHEIKKIFREGIFFLLVVVVVGVVVLWVCVCSVKEGRIRTFRVCFSV